MDQQRLNDNEVKEVAKMQRLIDAYEHFIAALNLLSYGKEMTTLKIEGTPVDIHMSHLWKWVREKAEEEKVKREGK